MAETSRLILGFKSATLEPDPLRRGTMRNYLVIMLGGERKTEENSMCALPARLAGGRQLAERASGCARGTGHRCGKPESDRQHARALRSPCAMAITRGLGSGSVTTEDKIVRLPSTGTPAPAGPGNGGGGYGERLARIEAKMERMATREDISELKALIERKEATMLRWLFGLVAVAGISLLATLVRAFL